MVKSEQRPSITRRTTQRHQRMMKNPTFPQTKKKTPLQCTRHVLPCPPTRLHRHFFVVGDHPRLCARHHAMSCQGSQPGSLVASSGHPHPFLESLEFFHQTHLLHRVKSKTSRPSPTHESTCSVARKRHQHQIRSYPTFDARLQVHWLSRLFRRGCASPCRLRRLCWLDGGCGQLKRRPGASSQRFVRACASAIFIGRLFRMRRNSVT